MKETFYYPEQSMTQCIVSQEPKVAIFTDNKSASVCFDFGETSQKNSWNDEEVTVKYCTRIRLKSLEYDTIVSEIVNSFYTSDEVAAITSNYINTIATVSAVSIDEDKQSEYIDEWTALQQLRTKAKEIAMVVVSNNQGK